MGATVTVLSNSPEIIVLTQQVVIQPHKSDLRIGQARVRVEGRQVGGEGTVTAYLGKYRARGAGSGAFEKRDHDSLRRQEAAMPCSRIFTLMTGQTQVNACILIV